MRSNLLFSAAVLSLAAMCSGCGDSGPKVAPVHGTVTLNGEPLSEANIAFEPDEGRSSHALTDASGHYELKFSATEQGAIVGKHTVRITTERGAKSDDSGKVVDKGVQEKLPPEYNSSSTLTKEVTAGENEINFEITTN